MAKNQHSQNSSTVCEKLRNAMHRRAHSPLPSSPAPAPQQTFPLYATAMHSSPLKAAARKMPGSGEAVPIHIDPHLLSNSQNLQENATNHQDSYKTSGQVQPSKMLKFQESMNDRFTAYITRVKHGMMSSSSNVGSSAKISSGHDSFDDRVYVNEHSSEYIRRAHMNMKNASTFGGGKNVTFK